MRPNNLPFFFPLDPLFFPLDPRPYFFGFRRQARMITFRRVGLVTMIANPDSPCIELTIHSRSNPRLMFIDDLRASLSGGA
jgi:hypothetical protein